MSAPDTTLSPLTALSPLDGRYHRQTAPLAPYFSELALIRYRVRVEVEYFIALCELPLPQLSSVDSNTFASLREVYKKFSIKDAEAVKAHERVTNHDVKAVEYFLRDQFSSLGLGDYLEFIHFGLTSQDINNTAIPLSLREALTEIILPQYVGLQQHLQAFSQTWGQFRCLPARMGSRLPQPAWVKK